MAITISGSGITSSEIADGTIVSGDIADGTITNADINASAGIAGTKVDGSFGKVLQVVELTSAGDIQASTETTLFSVSITPASSSSRFVVVVNSGKTNLNTSRGTHIYKMYRGSTLLTKQYLWADGGNYDLPLNIGFQDSPNTTSPITYYIKGYATGTAGWLVHDTAGQKPNAFIMEISQ